jgi:glycosyltransferase involved in cell wall biosynthesis
MTNVIATIPCFNEEKTIGSVALSAAKYANVIVIDDGSTDRSAEIAKLAGAAVISHSENMGYGCAIQRALREGVKRQPVMLVTLDADGQHNPDDIPRFIEALKGADIIIGQRVKETIPLYRRFGQWVLNLATAPKVDSQSGYRAYSSVALAMLNPTEKGMAVSSEIILQAKQYNLRIAQLPIEVSYAKAKRSPIGHGMGVLGRIVAILTLQNPLLVIGLPSLIVLAAGLYSGSNVLLYYWSNKDLQIGHALATIMLVVLGLQGVFSSLMLWAVKEVMGKRSARKED